MKAFVLEDDNERIKLFKKNFLKYGIVGEFYTTVHESFEALKTNDYDLIFLDHDLGGKIYEPIGGDNTGSMLARMINENKIDLGGSVVIIHSFNPEGAAYMKEQIHGSTYIPGIWKENLFASTFKLTEKG